MNFKMLSRDELFELQNFLSSVASNLNPTQKTTFEKLSSSVADELARQKQEVEEIVFAVLDNALHNIRSQFSTVTRNFTNEELAEIADQEFAHIIANGKPFG